LALANDLLISLKLLPSSEISMAVVYAKFLMTKRRK
jgi:hypothetical protein